MNEPCANFCFQHLILYFPAVLLFSELVDACPATFRYDVARSLLGQRRIGTYFHPREFILALKKLSDISPTKEMPIIRNAIESNEIYTSSSKKIHGTYLSYSNSPKTSLLLEITEPFVGSQRIKISNCMNICVHMINRSLSGTLMMQRIAQHVPFDIDTVHLRVMSYVSREPNVNQTSAGLAFDVQEIWRTYEDVDQLPHGELHIDLPGMCHEKVGFIRIDTFWHRDPRASLHF